MEPKDVLSYFMEICQTRNEYFQYNLASNAVLDWFGRTIKGNECIERFLRCDVWPQYEQNFVAAVKCGPIETRSTHEQAWVENENDNFRSMGQFWLNFWIFHCRKETPIENAIICTSTPAETVPAASGYESPPPSKRNLEKPPPLLRNKRYKKRAIQYTTASSSSDDDCESNHPSYNLRRLAGAGRQEGRTLRKRAGDTKPTEAAAAAAVGDDDEGDRSTSPMKRSKKMLDGIDHTAPATSSTANRSTHPMPAADFSKPFSELKYLESIGSIRTIRRAKHPNINRVPTAKTTITATPFVSPESQNGWDRKTKLKLSYRTGLLKKNDIQFALIIYEPLTMVTRRNLLEEFQRAALEEEQQKNKLTPRVLFSSSPASSSSPTLPLDALRSANKSINLKTPTMRNKPKNDKVSSLRRLRFWRELEATQPSYSYSSIVKFSLLLLRNECIVFDSLLALGMWNVRMKKSRHSEEREWNVVAI